MLILITFAQKTSFLTPKACFFLKKNAGRPHTGTQPKVILPEMPTFEILIPNKHRICLNMLYLGRFL